MTDARTIPEAQRLPEGMWLGCEFRTGEIMVMSPHKSTMSGWSTFSNSDDAEFPSYGTIEPGDVEETPYEGVRSLPAHLRLADHPDYGRVIVSRCTSDENSDFFEIFRLSTGYPSGAGQSFVHINTLHFSDNTLADMDEKARQGCVGMWANVVTDPSDPLNNTVLAVILNAGQDPDYPDEYRVSNAAIGFENTSPELVTPLFHVPRAYDRNGNPPGHPDFKE